MQKALEVDQLSKLYRIGSPSYARFNTSNKLLQLLSKPLQNYRKYKSLYVFTKDELSGEKDSPDILWALNNISFNVDPGEVIGLVGANGAGKSTLLKILSRVTPPTKGKCITRGRLSCLLEVGTGFHGELTGRENVYLNGTVLGMRKKEIDKRFDDIIDFSGVGKFVDTPVKRYSSGMNVRLAFSVMAHLDPDILIVDEVLAVGDAEFQRKCLNRMGSVGKSGKTVLFVSHNMAAVTRLCDRGLLIRDGEVISDSSAADVVHQYVTSSGNETSERLWPDINSAPGDDKVRLRSVRVTNSSMMPQSVINGRDTFGMQLTYDVLEEGQVLSPYITLVSETGLDLFSTVDSDNTADKIARKPGRYKSTVWVPGHLLAEGTYYMRVVMRSVKSQYRPFTERDIVVFTVVDESSGDFGTGWWEGRPGGVIRPQLDWATEYIEPEMAMDI
ncbi:MAG: ABC transporter ATP-binding protein [Pseudomonadota bacterium]|nr:ABC transporter ATP-binding protein [Pseudomonadota bacterium]